MPPLAPRRRLVPVLAGSIIVLALILWLVQREARPPEPASSALPLSPPPFLSEPPPPSGASAPPSSSTPPPFASHPALATGWQDLLDAALNEASPEEIARRLDSLRTLAHQLPPELAAASLIAFLRSGQDAPTGHEFIVGDEGVLDSSPTLRIAALDHLGQTDPRLSAAFALELFDLNPTSDEYALALRNLAWANPRGRHTPQLRSRFAALLAHPEWLAQPSTGLLEAFDLGVALLAVEEVAAVLRLTPRHGAPLDPALDRAAFIALDRIMLRSPQTFLARLDADPSFLDWAPLHRASLLARIDPRQPAQADTLRAYLLRLPPDSEELTTFAALFPNPHAFEGPRLVTAWESPRLDLPSLDQAARSTLASWLAHPDFALHREALDRTRH